MIGSRTPYLPNSTGVIIVEGVGASGDFQLAYELKRKYCSSELSLT